MADLLPITDSDQLTNRHVAQIINAILGLGDGTNTDWGIRWRLTGLSDADNYALELRNRGTGGKALEVHNSGGTSVLLQVNDDGITTLGTPITFVNEVRGFYGNAADKPAGWTIIGQNQFIYGANADGEVGATGGSATHTHEYEHSHDVPDHDHGNIAENALTGADPYDNVTDDGTSQTPVGSDTHGHNIEGTGIVHTTGAKANGASTADTTTDAGSSLPPYIRFYLIRRTT